MVRDRLKKSSVSIIAILLILILIVLPTGYEDAAIYKGTDRVRAKVISTDESSVINNGLIQSGEQYCKVKILDGKFKNETADAVNMLSGSLEADKIFQQGDVAHVVISYSKDKILSIMMSDHYRLDKEAILAGLFVLLLIGFAGKTNSVANHSCPHIEVFGTGMKRVVFIFFENFRFCDNSGVQHGAEEKEHCLYAFFVIFPSDNAGRNFAILQKKIFAERNIGFGVGLHILKLLFETVGKTDVVGIHSDNIFSAGKRYPVI